MRMSRMAVARWVAEVEQGLGLAAPVAAAGDPLAQGEDADQLSVRAERDGHHRLQHGHLAGDLARGGVGRAAPAPLRSG